MTSFEEFRIKSHGLLIELDAATTVMMALVSSRRNSGPEWDVATKRHQEAYQHWNVFLNLPTGPKKPPADG
ncbi:hypothetical protein PFAS1_23150 [Pseudomonas frederiksbergensis]|uniref:hypothetical protein n=1 Tax=Pseudomonas frederiksbergensis TaxID=104087 RepID=UPI00095899B8|nr:hypothetical protein [Pseudomonas frederiksbergensis]APV43229.1 hypothetical protein PFAS1_23150 [Pseudomonas frederiksbergensis]